jgi:antitoxin MazE
MTKQLRNMRLPVGRWGNSLALRIPNAYARVIGIKEGDFVQARLTVDGSLSLRAVGWDRKAFARELAVARESTPPGESVIEELRRGGRY